MKRLLLNPEVRDVWASGDSDKLLAAYERVWERKTILRQMYATWYNLITAELKQGTLAEIGGGTGNFKKWLRPRVCWTLDILHGAQVDVQSDALRLPFRSSSLDNIVMIDALHHLARPIAFLSEAARALRMGGRIVWVEPYVSVWGWFVYKFLHHEGVEFQLRELDPKKEAWDGNAAIPQMVLSNHLRSSCGLQIVKVSYFEFLSYPLSGGFSYRSVLPGTVLYGLRRLEQSRLFRNRFVSIRMLVVLEKAG